MEYVRGSFFGRMQFFVFSHIIDVSPIDIFCFLFQCVSDLVRQKYQSHDDEINGERNEACTHVKWKEKKKNDKKPTDNTVYVFLGDILWKLIS